MSTEIFAIVRKLQNVIEWQCVKEHAADFLREQQNVTESKGKFVQIAKENAKTLYNEIAKFARDVAAVEEYCRQNVPQALPRVPNVSLLKLPADLQQLADSMRDVEAALLERKELSLNDSSPAAKTKVGKVKRKPPSTPESDAQFLNEFEAAEDDNPELSEAEFGRQKGVKEDTARDILARARKERERVAKEVEKTKKERRNSRNLD